MSRADGTKVLNDIVFRGNAQYISNPVVQGRKTTQTRVGAHAGQGVAWYSRVLYIGSFCRGLSMNWSHRHDTRMPLTGVRHIVHGPADSVPTHLLSPHHRSDLVHTATRQRHLKAVACSRDARRPAIRRTPTALVSFFLLKLVCNRRSIRNAQKLHLSLVLWNTLP